MRLNVRAAGLAAAAFSLTAATLFAGPSYAEEAVTAPAQPLYAAHAAARSTAVALLANEPTPLASGEQPAAVAPVEAHLAAPVPVEPIVAPEQKRRSLADLVGTYAAAGVPDDEHHCLAGAIYFESKGEPLQGQLAVAEVIRNRASSGKFPKSLCGVVKQRGQFSFVRGGQFPAIAKASQAWREAVAIAHIAQKELAASSAPKALFFHARRVSPSWKGLKRVATVGNHVFYR